MSLAELSLKLQETALLALQRGTRPSTLPPHLVTGLRGEQAALFHLRRLGFTIVARRWTSAKVRGDLDLVAWDGREVVFFEIKTRTARDLAPAETSVDRNKARQLRLMAQAWLKQVPRQHRDSIPVRFDILAVYLLPCGAEFDHLRGAFGMRDRDRR